MAKKTHMKEKMTKETRVKMKSMMTLQKGKKYKKRKKRGATLI